MKTLGKFLIAVGFVLSLCSIAYAALGPGSVIPPGATQVTATSGNIAANTATATLPAVAGQTTYIMGFNITGTGATAGQAVVVTITGMLGGNQTFTVASTTGVAVGNTPLIVTFPAPIPASAVNTAISVSCATLGAGSTNNVVNAYGFTQ